MLVPRPLHSTGVVAFTWWLVLAFLAFFLAPTSLLGAFSRGATILAMAGVGLVLGAAGVLGWVALSRNSTRRLLLPDEVRGMRCSIGEVPFLIQEPRSAAVLPSFSQQDLPDVEPGFFERWMDHHRASHPAHVALLDKLLRIYVAHSHLPAAHIPGGHGGRSLLQHSCLCAYLMHVLAQSWEYKGVFTAKAKAGGSKKAVLELRDRTYLFDKNDPMAVIIGLCHDIGKIEAYLYDDGKVVGIRHEHDMTGARMIARMNEAWALPEADFFALMMSVAHYHHPMDLPVSPDRRAIDDRTIALMELLIRVDANSRAVEERGKMLSSQEEVEQLVSEDTAEPVTSERLIEELTEILLEPSRIDSGDQRHNLGSFCQVLGANTPLLILHETSLATVLAQRLRLDIGAKVGDGRSVIGNLVRKALGERDALRVTMKCLNAGGEHQTYSPESAIWQVGFYKKGSKGAKVDRITGYASIVIDPSIFPALKGKLAPYNWIAIIEEAMYPSRAKKSKGTDAAGTAGADQPNELANQAALPTLEPLAKSASNPATAPGEVPTDGDTVTDVDDAPGGDATPVLPDGSPDPATTDAKDVVDPLLVAAEQVAEEGGPPNLPEVSLQDAITSDADRTDASSDSQSPATTAAAPIDDRKRRQHRAHKQSNELALGVDAWKEKISAKVGPQLKELKPNNVFEATAALASRTAARPIITSAAMLKAHLEVVKRQALARSVRVDENEQAWVMAKPACELVDPGLDWDASIAAISAQEADAVGLLVLPFKKDGVEGVALGLRKTVNQG